MADPGESITAGQGGQQKHRLSTQDCRREQQQDAAAADEVQPARHRMAVLAEVERIELAEAGESRHTDAPGAVLTAIMRLPGRQSGSA
ncbi:hypothetical protein G6F57_012048 [Rhizopus arrhizus]|nr:hypothetical protein G6F22_019607 [Rhizopus arrhizus]KAG1081135.1 hypothetical protein G6F40_015616 [Rhizopus arrhizus]KAG1251143.1 hypothetical protein G6F65_018469 [Rhizopus arrhizus]KAG1436496.1 hypothetical protein G6F55_014205 [Rhizopus delemar]KAG1469786.1 hypothetical protein G6F57_012048 [Rhizopus arrhizus]